MTSFQALFGYPLAVWEMDLQIIRSEVVMEKNSSIKSMLGLMVTIVMGNGKKHNEVVNRQKHIKKGILG
jgi:hypothetical protein